MGDAREHLLDILAALFSGKVGHKAPVNNIHAKASNHRMDTIINGDILARIHAENL
jgi:hypothetical protein